MPRPNDRIELCDSPKKADPKKSNWWWHIRHKNGHLLLHSEMYTTKQGRTKSANRFSKTYGIPIFEPKDA